MPTILRAIDGPRRAAMLDRLTDDFVAEVAAAGGDEERARTQTEAESARAFPADGADTGHRFFEVIADGEGVGHVWVGPASSGREGHWWVWSVEIDAAHQGRGLGRRAMELAEEYVRGVGATRMGLNVFGENAVARRLYESLGYGIDSLAMSKRF